MILRNAFPAEIKGLHTSTMIPITPAGHAKRQHCCKAASTWDSESETLPKQGTCLMQALVRVCSAGWQSELESTGDVATPLQAA